MNTHEDLARLRKATRLADVLDAMGYTDLNVEKISSPQLIVLGQLARQNVNASQVSAETWMVVFDLLKQRRQYREALLGKEAIK